VNPTQPGSASVGSAPRAARGEMPGASCLSRGGSSFEPLSANRPVSALTLLPGPENAQPYGGLGAQ